MSSSTVIQDLPELSLLSLFDCLPLHYLLCIEKVCSSWNKLKLEALRQRKELIIGREEGCLIMLQLPNSNCFSSHYDKYLSMVKNEDGSPYFKLKTRLDKHILFANSLTPVMSDQITKLMPNLKVLRIVLNDCTINEIEEINRLLAFYRHQLVEVTIGYATDQTSNNISERNMLKSFFSSLNSMTKLKSLKLNMFMSDWDELSLNDLSVLSHLKTFNLMTEIKGTDVVEQLKQHAEKNEHFEVLHLPFFMNLQKSLSFGPRVSAAIKSISFYGRLSLTHNFDNFKHFAMQCSNLQIFCVTLDNVSFAQLTEVLALYCNALVYLSVETKYNDQDILELENNLPVNLQSFHSNLKVLKLFITTANHRVFELLNLNLLFPNVQVIYLFTNSDRCTNCAFHVPSQIKSKTFTEQKAYRHQVQTCARLARAPFVKFSKLTALVMTIYRKENYEWRNFFSFTRETLNAEALKVSYV